MSGETVNPALSVARHKVREMRKAVAALNAARDRQQARADREAARADEAERLVRDTSRELQRWKDRAQRAEAVIASAGLSEPDDGRLR